MPPSLRRLRTAYNKRQNNPWDLKQWRTSRQSGILKLPPTSASLPIIQDSKTSSPLFPRLLITFFQIQIGSMLHFLVHGPDPVFGPHPAAQGFFGWGPVQPIFVAHLLQITFVALPSIPNPHSLVGIENQERIQDLAKRGAGASHPHSQTPPYPTWIDRDALCHSKLWGLLKSPPCLEVHLLLGM